MASIQYLKLTAKTSALAVAVIAGSTTLVSAHSVNACIAAGNDFCDSVHGAGSQAAKDCRWSNAIQCPIHSHPGSSGLEPIDPFMSADPGHQVYNKKKGRKMRRR